MKATALATALLALAAAAFASEEKGPRSIYTDISDAGCTVIPASGEPNEEAGLKCRGPAGFNLLALSGDMRATVTIVGPDGKEYPLEFWDTVTGGFSSLGPRAEWRVRDAESVPYAVIVRVSASENPDKPDEKTSWLAVAKITADAVCVTDKIKGGIDDNTRARTAADAAASKPCLRGAKP
jgi:hypothetical protein